MVAMSRSGQGKQSRTRYLVGTPLAILISAALIVTLLVVAGCGRPITKVGTLGAHATVTPTSVVLPGAALPWTAGTLPPTSAFAWGDVLGQNFLYSFYIDPGDGNIAYACAPPASASVRMGMWATHDRAQQWKQLAPLLSGTQQVQVCMVIPDAADPSIVVVAVSGARYKDLFGAPPQVFISDFTQYVSFDGGAHWQPLQGPEPFLVRWLATYHGTTLAILDSDDGSTYLWSSTDQLQTWHELPHAPSGQPMINPANGDLLMVGQNGNIYESSDLGQHWTLLPIPGDLSPALVSPPVAGQPWRLCGIAGTVSDNPFSAGTLMCTMDSGRTWTSRPQLITTFHNYDKGIVVPQAAQLVALGADGTIYAQMIPAPGPYASIGIPAGLYRLTPQATRWQPLTLAPDGAVATTDIPGGGILWAIQGGGDGTPFAGPFPAASV